jgi:hypothetical protein
VDVSTAVGAGTGTVSAALATAGYPICDVKGVIAPQFQFEVQLPIQTCWHPAIRREAAA